jgi:hypothetical protein
MPHGKLQNPETPEQPWEWITVDFVGPLPKTKNGNDYLANITDRLTKYIHLVPTKITRTAEGMADLFVKHIVMNHGVPKYITSDRDKLFTSKFWQSVTDQMGFELRMTTAYRPQSNGQTERANQTIEQYLRHYVNYVQDDWEDQLPMAQFAYNNSKHSTTGISPFEANYGYHPNVHGESRNKNPVAEKADAYVKRVKSIQTQLTRDLEFMNLRMKIYYDKHHGEGPALEEGEKVFLLRRNIKTKRPSTKLDHIRLGPFIIEGKKGPVNYKLKLPESMKRIHPVFHISLLEPAPTNAKLADNVEIESEDEQEEYEVEKILGHDRVNGRPYYLVKWTGYDTSENTWEPIENLTGCSQLVKQYHRQKGPRHSRRKARNGCD